MIKRRIFCRTLSQGEYDHSETIFWLGILSLFVLIIGFVLASTFVAQIIISTLGGKLILGRFKPEWSDHKIWLLIIGVVIFAVLSAIPVLGWLIDIVAILFGLGALWTLGRSAFKAQETPALSITNQQIG